jgi:hypothetical protein
MVVFLFMSLLFGYIYEDADSLLVDNDTLTICGNHQYICKVHLRNRGQLFVRAATGATDSTGWLALDAPWIFITDSSSINGSERGCKGAYTNSHPWGYGPGGGSAGGVSGGGGGGGAYGGSGGNGGDYYGGAGGIVYGDSVDTLNNMGSGGGAGRLSVVDGAGGNAGAAISIRGDLIEIDYSKIITDGQTGVDGSVEAGGGGAGGGLIIWADTIRMHSCSLSANGGNGGNTMGFGGGGGAGGGRIKVLFSFSLDTLDIFYSVQGGAAGLGDTNLPISTPGNAGTIHIGTFTGFAELIRERATLLSITPNPVRNILKIGIEITPARVSIYDCTGRLIKKLWLQNIRQSIDLSELAQGIYFLEFDNRPSETHKIVKIE